MCKCFYACLRWVQNQPCHHFSSKAVFFHSGQNTTSMTLSPNAETLTVQRYVPRCPETCNLLFYSSADLNGPIPMMNRAEQLKRLEPLERLERLRVCR